MFLEMYLKNFNTATSVVASKFSASYVLLSVFGFKGPLEFVFIMARIAAIWSLTLKSFNLSVNKLMMQ